jgi:hypothetical protein
VPATPGTAPTDCFASSPRLASAMSCVPWRHCSRSPKNRIFNPILKVFQPELTLRSATRATRFTPLRGALSRRAAHVNVSERDQSLLSQLVKHDSDYIDAHRPTIHPCGHEEDAHAKVRGGGFRCVRKGGAIPSASRTRHLAQNLLLSENEPIPRSQNLVSFRFVEGDDVSFASSPSGQNVLFSLAGL